MSCVWTRAAYDSLRSQIIHCLAQVEALIREGEEGVYEQGINSQLIIYRQRSFSQQNISSNTITTVTVSNPNPSLR